MHARRAAKGGWSAGGKERWCVVVLLTDDVPSPATARSCEAAQKHRHDAADPMRKKARRNRKGKGVLALTKSSPELQLHFGETQLPRRPLPRW